MNRYIDAEKLKTIIEERKAQQDQWVNRYHDAINQGISNELAEILSIIASLQQEQPKLDLRKEVEEYYYKNFDMLHRSDLSTMEIVSNVARHFYELGKNAK